MDVEKLKYPIGKYFAPAVIDAQQIATWIAEIEQLPAELIAVAAQLTQAQLETTYRPGGWTLRQVITHLGDSHLNAFVRFKLTLTEDNPTIRPYFEDRWAETEEAKNGDLGVALNFLAALHNKFTVLLKSLNPADFGRTYYHPEHELQFDLIHMLGMYAWHGKHHLAQIVTTIKA